MMIAINIKIISSIYAAVQFTISKFDFNEEIYFQTPNKKIEFMNLVYVCLEATFN
jgi:hypothetical protein